jgi:hypothetical protein
LDICVTEATRQGRLSTDHRDMMKMRLLIAKEGTLAASDATAELETHPPPAAYMHTRPPRRPPQLLESKWYIREKPAVSTKNKRGSAELA